MAKRKYKKLSLAQMKTQAKKHIASGDKRKNYGFLVRKFGRAQASKITSTAYHLERKHGKPKKSLSNPAKNSDFARLGIQMKRMGFRGRLPNYPTEASRRAWIREKKPNPRQWPSFAKKAKKQGWTAERMKKVYKSTEYFRGLGSQIHDFEDQMDVKRTPLSKLPTVAAREDRIQELREGGATPPFVLNPASAQNIAALALGAFAAHTLTK